MAHAEPPAALGQNQWNGENGERANCPDNNNRRFQNYAQKGYGLTQKPADVEIANDAADLLADSGGSGEALPAVHQETGIGRNPGEDGID